MSIHLGSTGAVLVLAASVGATGPVFTGIAACNAPPGAGARSQLANCDDGPCPKNGTERTGLASEFAISGADTGSAELAPHVATLRPHFIGSLIAANGTMLGGTSFETVTSPQSGSDKQSANGRLIDGLALGAPVPRATATRRR
jgi:hypothetical protein